MRNPVDSGIAGSFNNSKGTLVGACFKGELNRQYVGRLAIGNMTTGFDCEEFRPTKAPVMGKGRSIRHKAVRHCLFSASFGSPTARS